MTAAEYLVTVKALIIGTGRIVTWRIVREEMLGEVGLYRFRVFLDDGSLLDMFERFEADAGVIRVTKHSFHWQDAEGKLRKRWDNAPHHPEVATHPHHLHDGSDDVVLSYQPVNAEFVLARICVWFDAHQSSNA